MLQRIKKNDTVCVITGKDKGTVGAVLKLDLKKNRVLVKGVGMITKHVKPRRAGEKGKIVKEESFIHLSNVMPVCPASSKPCRVRVKTQDDGKRVRMSHKENEVF